MTHEVSNRGLLREMPLDEAWEVLRTMELRQPFVADARDAALRSIERQIEKLQKERHVQNLEWAISLAESDPLYAEVFRPYFQKIMDALRYSGV